MVAGDQAVFLARWRCRMVAPARAMRVRERVPGSGMVAGAIWKKPVPLMSVKLVLTNWPLLVLARFNSLKIEGAPPCQMPGALRVL